MATKKKLGVLIVGPGWVAGEHIKGYCSNPNTEIKAIAGMLPEDKDRANTYMRQFGFQCRYADDYHEALKWKDIDIVSICTINYLHYEQALAAIQAGKHVLVEKPLAFNLKEAKKLKEEAERHKVKTHVGHVTRYYFAIRKIKDLIDKGRLGQIFYGECKYWHEVKGEWKGKIKTGGSTLLMGGIHAVDMMRWLIGEENDALSVSAFSTSAKRRKDFEYNPTITAIVRFNNGIIGTFGASLECNMPYLFHIQVNGTNGTIRNKRVYFAGDKNFTEIEGDYPDDWNVEHHPFTEEIKDFVDRILTNQESDLSFSRAYKTYELLFAAELSAREGKVIKLPL